MAESKVFRLPRDQEALVVAGARVRERRLGPNALAVLDKLHINPKLYEWLFGLQLIADKTDWPNPSPDPISDALAILTAASTSIITYTMKVLETDIPVDEREIQLPAFYGDLYVISHTENNGDTTIHIVGKPAQGKSNFHQVYRKVSGSNMYNPVSRMESTVKDIPIDPLIDEHIIVGQNNAPVLTIYHVGLQPSRQ